MFEFKPDYEQSKRRMDAFWKCELIDRPLVLFGLLKPPEQRVVVPESHHATPAERWLDPQYQAELARYQQQFEAVKPSGKSFVVLGKDGRMARAGLKVGVPAHDVRHEQRASGIGEHLRQAICSRLRHWHQCPAPRQPGRHPCRPCPTCRRAPGP